MRPENNSDHEHPCVRAQQEVGALKAIVAALVKQIAVTGESLDEGKRFLEGMRLATREMLEDAEFIGDPEVTAEHRRRALDLADELFDSITLWAVGPGFEPLR